MSIRRFAAYFFAIAAGSTFAFASTLRGQPPTQGVATERDMREADLTLAQINADNYGLSSGTTRLFRQSWGRRHRAPAPRAARLK